MDHQCCHGRMTGRMCRSARGVCTCVFLLFLTHVAPQHTCRHVHPTPDQVILDVPLDSAHLIRKRSVDQPLRIKLYYDESVYALSEEKYQLIHEMVMPTAVNYWEAALMVRKTESVIRLNRRCEKNQVFLLKGEPHPYCKSRCEAVTMCGEVQVPEQHLHACRVCNTLGDNCRVVAREVGDGIPSADFVFYISALETERCRRGHTVAYAAHCQQEAALDRPIAGHANLCPAAISTKAQELETLISTVKHEILHALGFSISLYAFYRDDDGLPLTNRTENGKPALNEALQARQWSERVIQRVVRSDWQVRGGKTVKEMNLVVTPRVREEVRRHFNCPDLEGAELEDQGHEGTALTHWEKRVFENEAMTGTHTQNPAYSRITLALMEDTGWYKANYHLAQPLKWGRHLGCTFAMKSCKEYMEEQTRSGRSIHPFCNKVKRDPLETDCTEDRSSVALCNLVEHRNQLPGHYQNFGAIPHVTSSRVGFYGGSVALADYCPYIQEFTWKNNDVVIRGSHCQYPENNPDSEKNFALEAYAEDSRCFNQEREWVERTCGHLRQWQHWGSGCYQYLCVDGRLHLTVANHTYTCYHAGQIINISIFHNGWLHEGAVVCPPCSELCEEANMVCRKGREPPKSVEYYRDELVCRAPSVSPLTLLSLSLSLSLSLVWNVEL
ncbi:leishmanolysin-like peptidase isoform X1 [Portunus trituberculatus]|uniref:leishmanolysin-like peptidase isoform X1 n=2 Tax=Portunus trituberculatus TaxID=210409 RepID=UPI001E1D1043|nr:leishmanolysin-like peptidase isoform X1 [Portunus trituberculatus]